MIAFFTYTFLLLFLCDSPKACFRDSESMTESQQKATSLKSGVLTGRILATSSDRTRRLDFVSATVIGLPGQSETKTILSCAHISLVKKRDPNCHFFYQCHATGKFYSIESAIYLTEASLDSNKDIGLFYLKDPISCNPLNVIARDFSQSPIPLSSLPASWGITLNDITKMYNFDGENPYFITNEFDIDQTKYIHTYLADQWLRIEKKRNKRGILIDLDQPSSQILPHASGSCWFQENSRGGYTFYGVSSSLCDATNFDLRTTDGISKKIGEGIFSARNVTYTLALHELEKPGEQRFKDELTALPPHREWIYRHIRGTD